eukprot:1105725-Amphidinium_carterae.1
MHSDDNGRATCGMQEAVIAITYLNLSKLIRLKCLVFAVIDSAACYARQLPCAIPSNRSDGSDAIALPQQIAMPRCRAQQ